MFYANQCAKSAATLTCSSSGTAGKNAIKADTPTDPDRPNTHTQNSKLYLCLTKNSCRQWATEKRERDSADSQLRDTISNDMNEPVFAGT